MEVFGMRLCAGIWWRETRSEESAVRLRRAMLNPVLSIKRIGKGSFNSCSEIERSIFRLPGPYYGPRFHFDVIHNTFLTIPTDKSQYYSRVKFGYRNVLNDHVSK
jgi:hypothetical protein